MTANPAIAILSFSETATRSFLKFLPSQIRLLRDLLTASHSLVTAEEIARSFTRTRHGVGDLRRSRVKKEKIEELLQTLVTLGHAREMDGGRFRG